MIQVKNLVKKYHQRTAVNDVSFTVARGEILGFLGPNGAGKSTTMKILSGFIAASSGSAMVNGFDVSKNPVEVKASIGYLPENPPVYTSMDVEGYLHFAAGLHFVKKPKIKAAVDEAMEKCGISDVRNRLIGNLSKGYRQRVGLAQAIVHKPPVLILDEPTVGLDPKQIIEIRNLIRSFGGSHTVILSTHILPEVQATCSRVVVIDRGKVAAEDTLEGIANRMQSSVRIRLALKQNPAATILNRIQRMDGVRAVQNGRTNESGEHLLDIECAKGVDVRAELAELCVSERLGLLALGQEKLSLEDAFVRLITKDEVTHEIARA